MTPIPTLQAGKPVRLPDPDLVVTGGKIYTLETGDSTVEAMLVRAGKIVATGTDAEVRAKAAPGYAVENVKGATVLPGLVDAHVHMYWTGELLAELYLFDCTSIAEMVGMVAEAAKQLPKGTWIRGRGWDENKLAEGRHPTRFDLDPVSPDHPVMLERYFNRIAVNSLALKVAGIDRETQDPPSTGSYAGYMERDENGDPTGLFRDAAKGMILKALPDLSLEDLVEIITRACRAFNSQGLTAIEEPNITEREIRAYQEVERRGLLTVRTDWMLPGWGYMSAIGEPENDGQVVTDWIKQISFETGLGDGMLRFGGIKMLIDGGFLDHSSRMFMPYEADPSTRGTWIIDEEEVQGLIALAHERNLAIDMHASGDEAQQVVVEAYAAVQRENPKPWLRHRIHHVEFPTERSLELHRDYGIPAVVQGAFITHLGDGSLTALGEARAKKMLPAKTYLEAGVMLAGSSDTPSADWDPWEAMYGLMARKTVGGFELDPAERLSFPEALRMYTVNGAYAIGRESDLGSLEPGKCADFILLEADPHGMSADEIRVVKPIATFVGGQAVHDVR